MIVFSPLALFGVCDLSDQHLQPMSTRLHRCPSSHLKPVGTSLKCSGRISTTSKQPAVKSAFSLIFPKQKSTGYLEGGWFNNICFPWNRWRKVLVLP